LWEYSEAIFNKCKETGSVFETIKAAIFAGLYTPFEKMCNYLETTFFGNSPSELGMRIVKGITSIGPMLFESLVMPFKKGWDFVKGIFTGDKVEAEVEVSKNVEAKFEETKPTENYADVYRAQFPQPTDNPVNQSKPNNDAVVMALNELIGLMKSGAIVVNLDGKRVSTQLSEASQY
jgi:hypothetical protein